MGRLLRSAALRRWADPALTLPQVLLAITSAAVAYGLLGPARGAILPVLVAFLMFGLIQLRPRPRPRTAILVGAYALGAFGAVMAWKATTEPAVFMPAVECGHFAALAAMLPAVTILAARVARQRARDRQRRKDLAQALARLQEQATHDELTGLVNRRCMSRLLQQERQRCARNGRPFAVALLDIDGFKPVNDHYGHAVGDEVLRSLARHLPLALRSTDVVARWGGEEFVVLLPESALDTARIGLERLRGRIAATPMAHVSGVPIRITVSTGLAAHIAGETVEQTLERADRALYEAKAQGRNRTVVA